MANDKELLALAKQQLRQQLREIQNRLDPQSIGRASQSIQRTVRGLPEYHAARAIMTYVSMGKEVETRQLLSDMQKDGKIVVIPWCAGDDLRLFRFRSFDELERGTLGILEPKIALRSQEDKLFYPQDLDVILVPGLGFDRNGNRLGRGRGYYDRFLKTVSPNVIRVGLAFECQLVEAIPVSPNDEQVDLIVTECQTYRVPRHKPRGNVKAE
ncbi:MAG: 5-formyltetrahydrofolate cyclo-ligase [Thermogutta sp.]